MENRYEKSSGFSGKRCPEFVVFCVSPAVSGRSHEHGESATSPPVNAKKFREELPQVTALGRSPRNSEDLRPRLHVRSPATEGGRTTERSRRMQRRMSAGSVNLTEHNWESTAFGHAGADSVRGKPGSGGRYAGDVVPGGESFGHFGTVIARGELVSAGPEVRRDRAEPARNRCAAPGERKNFMARSRCLVG